MSPETDSALSVEPEEGFSSPSDHGLRGVVEQLNLLDLLQMYHYGRRSVAIDLAGEVSGRLVMLAGELVHAQAGPLEGLDALCRLLRITSGELHTAKPSGPLETSLRGGFEPLVLEALRRLDEENHGIPTSSGHAESAPRAALPSPRWQEALGSLDSLDGFVGASLVDVATGRALARHAGRGIAEPVASAATQGALGFSWLPYFLGFDFASAEELVITLRGQYHLLRSVAGRPDQLLHLVLEKPSANLALGRLQLAAVAARFATERGGLE